MILKSGTHRRLAVIFGLAVGSPIFLSAGINGFGLGQSGRAIFRTSESIDVSANFLALTVLLPFVYSAVRFDRILAERTVLFCLATGASLIYGVYRSAPGDDVWLSFIYAAQTLLPVSALAISYGLTSIGAGPTLLRSIGLTIGAFCIIHLALTLRFGPDPITGVQGGFGPWNNSKILRFFPTAAALASPILVFLQTEEGRDSSRRDRCVAAACAALVISSHSRTALLLMAAVYACLAIGSSKGLGRVGRVYAVLACGVGVAIVGGTSFTRLGTVTGSDSDTRRIEAIVSSISQGTKSLFGEAFAASQEVSTNGQAVAINRIAISENQFGEYLVRGGLPLLGSFLLLASLSISRAYRARLLAKNSNSRNPLLILVITVGVVATGFTQLSFTETYFAPIAWAVLGTACATVFKEQDRPGNITPVDEAIATA